MDEPCATIGVRMENVQLDISVVSQRTGTLSANCAEMGDSTGAVLLEVVETPADVSTTGASRQVCARLARQWISTCWWFSDPEVFVPALRVVCPQAGEEVPSLSWCGEVCTIDASIFLFGKFTYLDGPFVFCSHPGFQRNF